METDLEFEAEIPKRHYIHFDRQFYGKQALAIVSVKDKVSHWSFLPFLHTVIVTRKAKRVGKQVVPKDPKRRHIYYASHRDAALYTFYAQSLGAYYEDALRKSTFDSSITAFRSGLGKSNIHFAHEVFSFIAKSGKCIVYTYDIENFFDSLDHLTLKEQWKKVIGKVALPPDHFKVYKSLTKFSYVDRDQAYKLFGISIHNPHAHNRQEICTLQDFKEKIRAGGFIHQNPNGRMGIPQGSPISAVLSNIYMLNFDEVIHDRVSCLGGIYRRYCDDIICVIPDGKTIDLDTCIRECLNDLKLTAHPSKSTIHKFEVKNNSLTASTPVQYLGLVFDGKDIRVRAVGFARYYAKFRSAARHAHNTRVKHDKQLSTWTPLKRKRLLVKYSSIGRHNFTAYILKAANLTSSPAIRKQLKPHLKKIQRTLDALDNEK